MHAVVNINTTEVRSAQQQMQYVIDVTRKAILVHSVLQKNHTSLSANEVSLDSAYLDTVGKGGWMTTVTLYGKQISFKLDTGAEVTAVSEETLKTLPEVVLRKPSKKAVWSITSSSRSSGRIYRQNICRWKELHTNVTYMSSKVSRTISLDFPPLLVYNLFSDFAPPAKRKTLSISFPQSSIDSEHSEKSTKSGYKMMPLHMLFTLPEMCLYQ